MILAEPPVDIGRAEAQREAALELLRTTYEKENLLDRVGRFLQQWLGDLLDRVSGPAGGAVSLAVIGLILVAFAALLLWSLRRITRGRRAREEAIFGDGMMTAAEHRAAAERLAAEERWTAAIQERLRAIARDLEERAVVSPLPGRTAVELATEAGRSLPDSAAGLAAAAHIFDDVTYGEAIGTPADYAALVRLDERLRESRVALEPTA